MTVEQVLKILEEGVAPLKVSDDFCSKFKMYDNSGIIINCGNPVTGALFSLDLSIPSVQEAIAKGCNLIVTHHPAIYGGLNRFDLTANAQARALAKCFKEGISVISMHLNFDAAPRGIDHYLSKGLGAVNCKPLSEVEGGAYGRVAQISPVPFAQFIEGVKREFRTDNIIVYGGDGRTVKKVASFCGAGLDDDAVEFAKREGADVAVSSDVSHHRVAELVESGIAVVQLTHYRAESYGFEKIYSEICKKLTVPSFFFLDGRYL